MSGRWANRAPAHLRGYDTNHRRLRSAWATKVSAGGVACWRCTQPIAPNEPWELGHDDDRPGQYKGPEHKDCNQRAGSEKGTKAMRLGQRSGGNRRNTTQA